MTLTVNIPDAFAASLSDAQSNLPRAILEGFAVEGYREGTLSKKQVRLLLGHDSRWETEDFLAAHGVWPNPSVEDVVAGAEALKQALAA